MPEAPQEPDSAPKQVRKKKVRAKGQDLPAKPPAAEIDIDQRRVEKLDELQLNALESPNPLQGGLRSAAGDLLYIGLQMKRTIVANIGGQMGVSDFDRVSPSIELLLRVSRQADRLASLDQRFSETQQVTRSHLPDPGSKAENLDFDTH
ncbi:MAG: hypothetical protein H8E66_25355 [Planctomycetes bacterium]|nr:hypothetical protein [Planctomycetota bacterium]